MTSKDIWGPCAWKFLHTITFAYPESPSLEEKRNHKLFFEQLQNILPCKICRQHFRENLKKYPIEYGLESRKDLIKWLVDFHNEVNKSLGKRQYSYQEVYDMYDDNKKINKYFYIIPIAFLILIILKNKIK